MIHCYFMRTKFPIKNKPTPTIQLDLRGELLILQAVNETNNVLVVVYVLSQIF